MSRYLQYSVMYRRFSDRHLAGHDSPRCMRNNSTGKMPVLKDIYPLSRQLYDSVIHLQQFRVLGEGAGPLGGGPTCILRLRTLGTFRCPVMHGRRARSTFFQDAAYGRNQNEQVVSYFHAMFVKKGGATKRGLVRLPTQYRDKRSLW